MYCLLVFVVDVVCCALFVDVFRCLLLLLSLCVVVGYCLLLAWSFVCFCHYCVVVCRVLLFVVCCLRLVVRVARSC